MEYQPNSAAGLQLNCAFYGKSTTFCTVILCTTKVILRSGPLVILAAILNVALVERIFRYYGCRAALFCISLIILENYHSIMLNTIRHLKVVVAYWKVKRPCHAHGECIN